MAAETISSAIATRDMTLGTTSFTLTVKADVLGQLSAIYGKCSVVWYYQIQNDGTAVTDGTDITASGDYFEVAADTAWPLPMGLHSSGADLEIAIQGSSAATLFLAPYPVTR